jgi:L-ribulose-5-phosphate 3-epimerase
MQSRREFLGVAGAAVLASSASAATAKPKLRKAVKYTMIGEGKTPKEKFELVKSLGFEGVEMDSPSDLDVEKTAKAAKEVGIVLHGVINSTHWQIRMSDPDPAMRAKAVENMKTALNDAKVYGAETVLLVPGKVSDPQHENYQQCFERSQACVRECIPMAEEFKIKICIETVWNNFITKVEQMNEYVDSFKNPIVGCYFDVSNMIKFGMPSADWIRHLGKRLYKFDFKGYSKQKGFSVPIGEGDENWPDVLKALDEVGYSGWATSEVKTGDRKYLADVAKRMDHVLGLSS